MDGRFLESLIWMGDLWRARYGWEIFGELDMDGRSLKS
jgi:hypothetical protein